MNRNIQELSNYTVTQTVDGADIQWEETNKTRKLIVVFKSGATIQVVVQTNMLSLSLTSSEEFFDNTRGLLGVHNNDVSDDFTAPDGSSISINSTQEEIYNSFGLFCKYFSCIQMM